MTKQQNHLPKENDESSTEEYKPNQNYLKMLGFLKYKERKKSNSKSNNKLSKKVIQPEFLTEAHKKNEEAVLKYIAETKNLVINWEEEIERQKWNSQDH